MKSGLKEAAPAMTRWVALEVGLHSPCLDVHSCLEPAVGTVVDVERRPALHERRVETEPCPPGQVTGARIVRAGDSLIPMDYDGPRTSQQCCSSHVSPLIQLLHNTETVVPHR